MIIKNYIQGSQEWLEMRKTHIMASDTPVIMGVSPWKTPLQLWEEKLGLKEAWVGNYATRRGNELEPQALALYNELTGNNCKPCVIFSEEFTWMGASLDGLSKCGKIVVEIKCPGKKDHELAAQGLIPEKYMPQLQKQLYVSGNYLLQYYSYSKESSYLIEVKRDEEFIKRMLAAEIEFWDMIQSFTPPIAQQKDACEIDNPQWIKDTTELLEVRESLKALKKREADLISSLVVIAEDRNCYGNGIKLQKVVRVGSVDYSIIPELDSVDLDKYRKPDSEYWKVS